MIFEVFTERQNESDALETILKLRTPKEENILKRKIKTAIRLGNEAINNLLK